MSRFSRTTTALLGAVLVAGSLAAVAAARVAGPASHAAAAQVCVLLPDTKTSVRYELFDRPYLAAAFKKAKHFKTKGSDLEEKILEQVRSTAKLVDRVHNRRRRLPKT